MEMYFAHADIQPIPHQTFPVNEIEQAFRCLQRGRNIGKVLVTLPEDSQDLKSSSTSFKLTFDPNASYLLTGGLGGIGRSISTWMIERGARRLIFLSPSADSPAHTKFLKELESMGCETTAVAGKVQDVKDLQDALATARSPIKGVFHLALQLHVSWT